MNHFWRFTIFVSGMLPVCWILLTGKNSPGLQFIQDTDSVVHPKDYFGQPVPGAVNLTGTCGELRPDHFHAGVDIDGVTGAPILASADGYIDLVKVSCNGYGNVLYIKHPNGYTTVYAHLDKFTPEIQVFVRENQYRRESFEIELNPPVSKFPVKKGQEIGKMGNTGSSAGSHLHFEVRDPQGRSINPLLLGIPVADNIAPEFRDMKFYILNEKREVLSSKPFPLMKDKTGHIGLADDTVRIGAWRVGFGVKAYDRTNGRRNDNGVYSVTMWADDQLAFEWTAETFDFDETRYLNAHIDYSARKRYGAWFHRCFVLPGNELSNYTVTPSMGAIKLYKDKPVQMKIKIADALGNSNTLVFWVLRDADAMETIVSPPYQFDVPYNSDTQIDVGDFSAFIPYGALYEQLGLQFETKPPIPGAYSPVHRLHDNLTPVHKYFDVSIRTKDVPDKFRDKAVIANVGEGRPDNCGGEWNGNVLSTRVRHFGSFCVMADTIAPTITPVVFGPDMRKKSTMAFRINDNFAVTGTANGMRYRGTIDGEWVLFEYDKKRARLTHVFDKATGPGEHLLSLSVTDDRGNIRVFERKFKR